MHPRNPYSARGIDFTSLALKSPSFAQHLNDGQGHLDFKNPEALRALNEATLEHDWGLHVTQPADRLCPPIPNRLDYLLWVQDVLRGTVEIDGGRYGVDGGVKDERPKKRVKRSSGSGECENDGTPSPPHILDIGTGATAIYPILGCALDPSWTFTGTDIDADSLANARRILDNPRNNSGDSAERQPTVLGPHACRPLNLKRRITLLQRDATQDLLPHSTQPFSITICNPPFYTNQHEMDSAAAAKHLPPRGACVGSANEMVYSSGGEVGFVTRMIEQSAREPGRARWYSSLLGKASSIAPVLEALRRHNVDNYGFTSFAQGQTRRWAVIWSHGYCRLPDELVRLKSLPSGVGQGMMPSSSTIMKEMPGGRKEAREALKGVGEFVRGLRGVVVRSGAGAEGEELFLRFGLPSWTRAARRAASREKRGEASRAGPNDSASTPAETEPILCLLVSIVDGDGDGNDHSAGASNGACQLRLQWTYGKDRAHFESFASAVLRRLSNGDGQGKR